MTGAARVCFSHGFRPFFLGAGLQATVVTPVWAAIWLGALPPPTWLAPSLWHAHEMIFGLVAAAAAGFLLTAAPVWAGRPPPAGASLAALFSLWLAGRLAMAAAGLLPAGVVAAVDGIFLPALALTLAGVLRGAGQRRNHGIVALVAILALANLAVHAFALGWIRAPLDLPARGLRLAVHGMVVMLLVIGGRITPAFTANALRRAGSGRRVVVRPWAGRVAIGATLLFALCEARLPATPIGGALAVVAGLAAAVRMSGWQTRAALRDPLLGALHVGMAWVPVGLVAIGASELGVPLAPAAGLHALTAGAMGGTILAVMTRVPLGHTGRPLVAPPAAVAAYALVHAGALARVAAALLPGFARPGLALGAALWAGAFALYVLRYAPILLAPRLPAPGSLPASGPATGPPR